MVQLEELANYATIFGLFAGGAAINFSGFRLGPMRAFTVAFRPMLLRVENKSVRASQVLELNSRWSGLTDNASYVLLEGPKGVGKSCLIDTCLMGKKGILRVTVAPNSSQEFILNNCFHEIIGGPSFNITPQKPNVGRVLFFYHLVFRTYPTIVMSTSERPPDTKPAEVTGAIRELAGMGVKVLLDSSPNSLPPDAKTTERQDIMYIGPMSHEQIRSLPQLKQLFEILDQAGLSSLVLDMLGGIPAKFARLARALTLGLYHDPHVVVDNFLCTLVNDVLRECQLMSTREPKFREIFALFKDKDVADMKVLEDKSLELPSPCKVLISRVQDDGGKKARLVPSTPIAAFVFHHGGTDAAVDAMEKLVQDAKTKASASLSST